MVIIDTILSVAKALLGFTESFKKARRERKDRIANYFEEVSKCLEEVSKELKADRYPHGKCAEMGIYADRLTNTVGHVIGKVEAKKLAKNLKKVHEVEKLFSELYNSPNKTRELTKLDEASGIFRALAVSLRAE